MVTVPPKGGQVHKPVILGKTDLFKPLYGGFFSFQKNFNMIFSGLKSRYTYSKIKVFHEK